MTIRDGRRPTGVVVRDGTAAPRPVVDLPLATTETRLVGFKVEAQRVGLGHSVARRLLESGLVLAYRLNEGYFLEVGAFDNLLAAPSVTPDAAAVVLRVGAYRERASWVGPDGWAADRPAPQRRAGVDRWWRIARGRVEPGVTRVVVTLGGLIVESGLLLGVHDDGPGGLSRLVVEWDAPGPYPRGVWLVWGTNGGPVRYVV